MTLKDIRTNEDYVEFLSERIRITYDDAEEMLHQFNNLRADEELEWLQESLRESVPYEADEIIEHFKGFFNVEDEDDSDDDFVWCKREGRDVGSIIKDVKKFMFGDETRTMMNSDGFQHGLRFITWLGIGNAFIVQDADGELYRVTVEREE